MKKIPKITTEERDLLHDLDAKTGTTDKTWSVNLARQLGLSADQIERYLGKQKK